MIDLLTPPDLMHWGLNAILLAAVVWRVMTGDEE